LEEILEEAKKEFLSKLDKAGIKGGWLKIYFEELLEKKFIEEVSIKNN